MRFVFLILFVPLLTLYSKHLEAATQLELKTIERGASSGLIKKNLHFFVISDQTRFETLYRKIRSLRFPPPPMPEIDFDKNHVLVALMGQQMTSGYAIDFDPLIGQNDKTIQIKVRLKMPPPDGMILQMLTAPYVIAVMPRGTYEEVHFLSGEDAVLETIKVNP